MKSFKMGYDNISDIFIAEYVKEKINVVTIKQNTCITVLILSTMNLIIKRSFYHGNQR